jgi:hypothetical protein
MTNDPWVLKRTDARGGYVARDPAVSVTFYLADARTFTREEATSLALANEMPCPVSALLAGFPL